MNEESQLIYPTVDLFLYDLREGLRQNSKQVELNRQMFWHRIYGKLDKSALASLAAAESLNAEYVELLGANRVKKFERLEPPYKGFYYPIQLKIDTYALQVDCSTGFNVNGQVGYIPHPISFFRQIIEHEIKPRISNQDGKLGQTWLIWGQLPAISKEPEKIAKECYLELAPNGMWNADFQGQGMLSGGALFELWQAPTKYESISETYHLMIWLFPARDSIDFIEQRVAKIYVHFIHLFAYRSKIIWADYQSRQLTLALKNDFKEVQVVIDTVSQRPTTIKSHAPYLLQLQEHLTHSLVLLSRYANNLSLLNSQSATIRVNLENYQKRLQILKNTTVESDIDFLDGFAKIFASKRQAQIETDYASLNPGLILIENLISTIKGTIEICQAVRDRKLNNTVSIAGIGLATSQIASSVIVAQYPPGKGELFLQTPAFVWSLFTGLVASALVWFIIRLLRL